MSAQRPVAVMDPGGIAAMPLRADAPHWRVDPIAAPADPGLIGLLGAGNCLRLGVLPWRHMGGAVVVLAPDPAYLAARADALAPLGPLRFAACDAATIRAGLRQAGAALLVHEAENRVDAADSCRDLALSSRWTMLAIPAILIAVILALPLVVGMVALVWAALTLLLTTAIRLAAVLNSRVRPGRAGSSGDALPLRMPVISLLVPLFRETEVAAKLLTNLAALDYPAEQLDICLIVEEEDDLTRATLRQVTLPAHVQVIEVPAGSVRTKPRALNFALNFARGTIIGIYDAEDRPAPDQLLRVVQHFARAGPDVACLQGSLDYYNHRFNWIARCFTLEYASWFRVILPGLSHMGLVVPLGGTTLFLRRHAIEVVGGWDAHNVTEDADLGIRLARRGYRTEIIDTVTEEEANARAWAWVKQRTRWLKGYAMTWVVHSRDPSRLLRDLGPWRFFGVQILLFGTLSQFLLAPLFMSFWLIPLGIAHPLQPLLPPGSLLMLTLLFVASEIVNLIAAGLGAVRAGKAGLIGWIPMLHAYFPLATVAAWRAVWQALRDPFRWEKTAHGIFDAGAHAPPARADSATGPGLPPA